MAVGTVFDRRVRRVLRPVLSEVPLIGPVDDGRTQREAAATRVVMARCTDAPDILAALGLDR